MLTPRAGQRVIYILISPGEYVVSQPFAFEVQGRRGDDCVGEFLLKRGEARGIGAQWNKLDFLFWIDAVAREDQSCQHVGRIAEAGKTDFFSR